MTDIVFRIVSQDPGTAAMFGRVDKALDGLQQRQNTAAKGFGEVTKQSAFTRQEMLALNYTASDVAASLASGASPWTILLQQGGQVKDAFGGIGPLFSKLGTLFTVGRVAAGGLAVALGGVAIAAYQGWEEQKKLATSLFLTNNAAGLTAGTFNSTARAISEFARRPIGDAREALMALTSTGAFTTATLTEAGVAVSLLEKYTGESAEKIVADFATMRSGVAKWAAEHNRSYNYLTVEVYRHIRSLEAQGRTQEAMRVNLDALNQRLGTTTPRNLGYLETAWEKVGKWASWAWDQMKGVGRDETTEERIERLTKVLNDKVARGPLNDRTKDAYDRGVTSLKDEIYSLQEKRILERKAAERQAADAAKNQREIAAEQQQSLNATAAMERAKNTARERDAELARGQERIAVERAYRERESNAVEYINRINQLDQQALDAKAAVINAELALEKRRPVGTPAEKTEQDARALEIQSRLKAVELERAQLNERIRTGTNVKDLDRGPELEDARTQFLRFEREQQAANEQAYRERGEQATGFYREMVEANKQMSIDLIQDDRARGMAQLKADEEVIRKRLDLGAMGDEERRRAEGDLAEWRRLREATLTEQLKPEWQRQLDAYRDVNRLMRDSFNNTMDRLNTAAEDAWLEFQRTGKVSVQSLVKIVNDELARIGWRKYLAQGASDLLGSVLGMFGLGGGAAAGAGGAAAGGVAGGGFKAPAGFTLHTGGVVGRGGGTARSIPMGMLQGAPKFHNGGLASDEVPAILRKNEEVLTRDDPRHRLNGGAGSSFTQNNVFNVPPGVSPAAYAGAVSGQLAQLKADITRDMTRPGTALRRAARAA